MLIKLFSYISTIVLHLHKHVENAIYSDDGGVSIMNVFHSSGIKHYEKCLVKLFTVCICHKLVRGCYY